MIKWLIDSFTKFASLLQTAISTPSVLNLIVQEREWVLKLGIINSGGPYYKQTAKNDASKVCV